MFQKISSLIFDKRFPYFLLYKYLESQKIKKSLIDHKIKNLKISLTFDVERLPENGLQNPINFFTKISRLLNQKRAYATFFVEGSLTDMFPESLRLIKKNEIGLHGFQHELWGNEKWWVNKKPLKYKEKRELLKKSIDIFETNGFKRPKSFRAPYMIINNETKKILTDFDFEIDSSDPSYLGIKPIPIFQNNLIEIPVTANPMFKTSKRFFIPFAYYEIFNMEILKRISQNDFIDFINNVVNFQVSSGIEPHLVFLAHSWEFSHMKTRKFNYSSEKNYEILLSSLELLEKKYKIKYLSLEQLSKELK